MCLTWRGLQTTKLCCNSVSSLKCLFCCVSIHSRAAPRLGHLAHLLLPSLRSPSRARSFIATAFSSFLHLRPLSETKPVCVVHTAIFHPTTLFFSPSLGRQASRLGAQMVFWQVSQLWVSEPAGRQRGPSVADMAEASPGTCL